MNPGPEFREALKAHKEAKDLVSGDCTCDSRSELTSPLPFPGSLFEMVSGV